MATDGYKLYKVDGKMVCKNYPINIANTRKFNGEKFTQHIACNVKSKTKKAVTRMRDIGYKARVTTGRNPQGKLMYILWINL